MIDPSGWSAAPLPDAEHHVAVPGGRIWLRVNGDLHGSRPPLLMAHGGPGGCHAGLLPTVALADERAVILYDQLDCGLSDRPGDPVNWTVARFAAEIAAIRACLNLDHVHLLGHSWGAVPMLEHAARHGTGVASLILQGPLVSTRRWRDDAARLIAALPDAARAALAAGDDAAAVAAATDLFYARHWRREPVPAWLTAYEASLPCPFNAGLYVTMWGANEFTATGMLADYDGESLLAGLTSPLLVLTGEHDEVLPDTARALAGRAPRGETMIVPGAAHRPQNDRPVAWLNGLREWMERFDDVD